MATKVTRRGNNHPSAALNALKLENAERLIEAVKESGNKDELTNHTQQAQIYLGGIDSSLYKMLGALEVLKPLNDGQFANRVISVLGENTDDGGFEVFDEVKTIAYELGRSFMRGMQDVAKGAK